MMALQGLNWKQTKDILMKGWMTHDALWYGEVAKKYGMAEASPMNLRVCKDLGKIECGRLMRSVHGFPPQDMAGYRELFDLAMDVFVPDFMKFEVIYPEADTQVFRIFDCFAHRGMEKAGLIGEYECGIFERIEGWFAAMGVSYTRTPDLSRCLIYTQGECVITVKFHFA